jgi:hypothetical protein
VGKPEGKRPLGRPRHRWVDNIKMDLLEIGWGGVDWIGLAEDRDKWRALVNVVINLKVPYNAGKLSSSYTIGGLSSSTQFHRVSECMFSSQQRYSVNSILVLPPVLGGFLFREQSTFDIRNFQPLRAQTLGL